MGGDLGEKERGSIRRSRWNRNAKVPQACKTVDVRTVTKLSTVPGRVEGDGKDGSRWVENDGGAST